jgi:hypothetical protein
MTDTPQTRLLAEAKRLLECYKRHGDCLVSFQLLEDFDKAVHEADADLEVKKNFKIASGNAFMLAARAALGIVNPAQRIIIDARCDNIVTVYVQLLGDQRLLALDLETLLKDADVATLAERAPKDFGWKSGPPPRFDDGRIILIVLHQPTSRNYGYGGAPIAVSCWTDRLKATCNDEPIDYDEVKEWIALNDLVSPE